MSQLIPSIRRVLPLPNSTSQSPLLPILVPLLQSTKDITNKYRNELPTLIETGGDGEDPEEAMMVFAWTHEKRTPPSEKDSEEEREKKEAQWTRRWLQRHERREYVLSQLFSTLCCIYHFNAQNYDASTAPPLRPLAPSTSSTDRQEAKTEDEEEQKPRREISKHPTLRPPRQPRHSERSFVYLERSRGRSIIRLFCPFYIFSSKFGSRLASSILRGCGKAHIL